MARIVMKFGGTSMAGIERIRHVSNLVKREAEQGNEVAVVVSAMAGETDRLVQLCREAASLYDPREYDVVVASGEQVTSGLLAITLQGMGVNARSYMSWQLPVRTTPAHSAAMIDAIDADVLEGVLTSGGIAVIPGFQGVTGDGDIATLGRGGSDTSAVALAAAMRADRCDIYTDVDGVYTTDPRIVPKARKLARVTYEEMLELASVGAKVLQTRSVGLAMRHNLPLQVLSSFEDRPGTLIVGDAALEDKMERQLITGIAVDKNEAMVTLTGLQNEPGVVGAIFAPLAEAAVNVDMIVQSSPGESNESRLTFTVPAAALAHSIEALKQRQAEIGFSQLQTNENVAKVSVVGVGMRSNPGVAAAMFKALGDRRINILAITTSEIKVSVLIDADYTELAVRVLHTAYGLDAVEEVE
ncbi:MAG TPA: aspartate kinase [Allosphingosinicella sp.]|nr:aspartate kinase [Allosphingosinicella sp.]